MIAVVVSREDTASLAIRDALLRVGDWTERGPSSDAWRREWTGDGMVMVEKEGLHLDYDGVDADIRSGLGSDVGLVVFVSRHSGDTGQLLTAHHTGNFGEAEYGGEPRSLAAPAPDAARHLLRRFDAEAPDGFDVSMEATHHGPTELGTPSVFAEVGSGPDEWGRDDAAEAVARGVLSLPGRDTPERTVVGVGGGHYAPRFTRVVLGTDAAVGHVAADYAVADLDGDILREAYELSGADAVLLGGEAAEDPPGVVDGYDTVTETYLRQRAGVPEVTADAVLGALGDGATLTERASETRVDGDDVVLFDGAAVREARTVDRGAADGVLGEHALGYTEDEGRVAEVAVADEDTDGFAEAVAGVLRSSERYEEVRVDDGGIVAVRSVFDPERARELGVPEGPIFGRLSSGEAVEVDGDTVEPGDVHRREETFLPLRV